MTTQTNDALGGDPKTDAIPPGLKRVAAPKVETPKTEAKTQAEPKKTGLVAKIKAAVAAKTPAKAAKTEAKKPAHKPSTIASTEDNPAKSIVPVRFKQAYAEHNDTCGRPMNVALKTATTHKNADGRDALDVKALVAIAKANGVDFARYEALNPGQQRMNVGNKLAGLLKAGKKVTIGKQVFANAEKALAAPKAA